MASPSTFFTSPLLLIILTLLSLHVYGKAVIPEDGFTVTTLLDGHKLHINPYSVLQRPGSSDLIVLDSTNSVFYTVQFPISQQSVVTRFSGEERVEEYTDGDVGSARFDKPRSFAVDLRGNLYVADKNNHAIRKISGSRVTTIAGGSSEKSNRKDGPALNASFSEDFELTFIPGQCALLVSDHQYQLVRQINLKEEDCTLGSKSGLGAVKIWTLGLFLSCLLGLGIGFLVRPYIIRQEASSRCHFIKTWKHCLASLGKLVLILYFGIKSAVASCSCSSVYTIFMRLLSLCLSHLLLMFRINLVSPRPHLESVSLLDLDGCNSGEVTKSSKYHDQLKDLISFDEDLLDSTNTTFNQGYGTRGRSAVIPECHGADVMMLRTNIGLAEAAKDKILQQGSSVCSLGMVKRR